MAFNWKCHVLTLHPALRVRVRACVVSVCHSSPATLFLASNQLETAGKEPAMPTPWKGKFWSRSWPVIMCRAVMQEEG